jgi:hypothetical protein
MSSNTLRRMIMLAPATQSAGCAVSTSGGAITRRRRSRVTTPSFNPVSSSLQIVWKRYRECWRVPSWSSSRLPAIPTSGRASMNSTRAWSAPGRTTVSELSSST